MMGMNDIDFISFTKSININELFDKIVDKIIVRLENEWINIY